MKLIIEAEDYDAEEMLNHANNINGGTLEILVPTTDGVGLRRVELTQVSKVETHEA